MTELASMVHEEHIKANAAWSSALEHARNAGVWLVEAKWRMGHRTKWGRWKRMLAKEYHIAERTMSQYMQIARHWENPRVKAARAEGFTVDSISTFVQLLRGNIPRSHHSSSKEPNAISQEIRKEIAAWLRTLDACELSTLDATLDDWMATANADLRERVCGHYGGPYYRYREEHHRERETTAYEKEKAAHKMRLDKVARVANADVWELKAATRNAMPFLGNAEPTGFKSYRRVRRPGKRDRKG